MAWETLYCPHRHCRGYGKPFSQGYLVKNGTSRGRGVQHAKRVWS
jgi:hypothetical protein